MKRSLGLILLIVCFVWPLRAEALTQRDAAPAPALRGETTSVVPGVVAATVPAVRAERLPHWNPRKPQASVSEPSTLLMMALGLLGAARFVRQ